MNNNEDHGLETLLELDGVVIEQERGHWVKFDVARTTVTKERPHGLRYSLTLHDKYGKRQTANGLRQCPRGQTTEKI